MSENSALIKLAAELHRAKSGAPPKVRMALAKDILAAICEHGRVVAFDAIQKATSATAGRRQ